MSVLVTGLIPAGDIPLSFPHSLTVSFMHTLTAFYGSITNNVTDTLVPAIADQIGTVMDQRYMFSRPRQLLQAFAGVPNGTAVRVDAPSFNGYIRPVINPIDADATLGGNLPPLVQYNGRGVDLPSGENIGPLVTRAGAAAADCAILLWHTGGFRPAPSGKCLTVRATSSNTGASGGWRLQPLTFDQSLPNGTHAVIGMTAFGTNVLAARLVFPNQVERPGTLANVDQSSWVYPSLRFGSQGLFGQFNNLNPPQVELLSYGTMTTQVYYFDLVRLSDAGAAMVL